MSMTENTKLFGAIYSPAVSIAEQNLQKTKYSKKILKDILLLIQKCV